MAAVLHDPALAERLALWVKTVEGAIANILSKLDLEPDPDQNRLVLAVLTYLDPSGS
jgi:hypothetical protein